MSIREMRLRASRELAWISRLSLFLACLLGWLPEAASPHDNRPIEDDTAALACKVVKEVEEGHGVVRLCVEVSNPGQRAVEPLVFRLEHVPRKAKGKQASSDNRVDLIARVAFPFANRSGRPVPPKGKTRYWLATIADAQETLSVTVARACFLEPASLAQPVAPDLEIGKLERLEQKSMDGRPLSVSGVRVVNPLEVPLDAIFLATTKEPRDEQVLLGVRLAPGANDWVISQVVLPGPRFEYDTPHQAVRVEKLELVDWCLVGVPDPGAAAARLERAYRGWLRWTEPFPGIAGSLRATVQSSSGQGQPVLEHELAGRFRLDAEGRASVELDPALNPGIPADKLSGLESASASKVQAAFADLRRASFEELCTRNALRSVAEDAVEIEGAGFAPKDSPYDRSAAARKDPGQTPNLVVRDGRIVASGDRSSFERLLWSARDLGAGYVVTQRRTPAGDWCYQFAYELLDGQPVVCGYRESWGTLQGELLKQFQAQFFDLELDRSGVAVTASPPAGEGAEALRAVWESGYRYPDTPRELSFVFEVRTPGTDGTWQGLREVDGRARLGGFRGFRMSRAGWSGFEAELPSSLAAGQRSSLGFALFDRLVLWSGRDFHGREPFERQFAACEVLAPAADGSFEIRGGPLERVVVKDGLVAAIHFRGSVERRFTWTKQGEQRVVARVTTGEEVLSAKYVAVGGWLLPSELELTRVFGPDWGPERIRLRELTLR